MDVAYRIQQPTRDSRVPRFLAFRVALHAYLLINVGRSTRELIKIQIKPIERSNPRLAVPAWGETAKLPKLAAVVNELKTTARAVLDFRNAKFPSERKKRWYICMELSIPKPKSKGSASIFAKFIGRLKRANNEEAKRHERQTGKTMSSEAEKFPLVTKTTRKMIKRADSRA